MREKLLDLMRNEGLKPSQLAEMLEINPAGVSHILAGRNKPGFDLLQKILRRFPQINPDWLLLDSKKMYRDESATNGSAAIAFTENNLGTQITDIPLVGGLFGHAAGQQQASVTQQAAHAGKQNTEYAVAESGTRTPSVDPLRKASASPAVARVMIFYEDRTFESFTPNQPDIL